MGGIVTRPRVKEVKGRPRRGTRRWRKLARNDRLNLGCRCCDTVWERKMQVKWKKERFLKKLFTDGNE